MKYINLFLISKNKFVLTEYFKLEISMKLVFSSYFIVLIDLEDYLILIIIKTLNI